MGFFSSIGNFVSSVASTVKSTVSSAWSAAKNVASKAVGWMAEKAETFVNGVKKAWQAVKPFVEKIRQSIQAASQTVSIPWLKAALTILDKTIGTLTAFENSPIAKKVDSAIKWAIDLAKRWESNKEKRNEYESELSEEELTLAKQHQENLRFAEREVISEEQRHNLELASAINDYEIARADLNTVISSSPSDFEHYLRLRATQKLLNLSDKKFRIAKSIDEISADDLFLVRVASDLIKGNPELNQSAAERLDRVLMEKYHKKLTPFIFEELIASWCKRADSLGEEWTVENKEYSKNKILLIRLNTAKKIQEELSEEESILLDSLEKELPEQKNALDKLSTQKQDIERYVGAAEGFLQLLEKSPEEIESEDREFIIEDGSHVGKILIDCAEHDRSFSSLNAEDRSLITDYANIFKNESKERMETILEVAV
ncbi:hypothetical protein LL240_06620 [Oceanimonas baumannii]|uniref:hypothetical protein n=1 Tax=Oceanimonas baumannii TaxID=129578 RepID=UPI001D190F1D|nr:hypothetical protein [Oceanimonas baumannii]MCC4264125.1 hypothetical protein [Oceanimonas baumannii]